MKKLKIILLLLVIAIFYLAECGKTQIALNNLIVITPNNQELSLYMERDEVEKILGTNYHVYEVYEGLNIHEYGDIAVRYTDGLLGGIIILSDTYRLKSGITIGSEFSDYEKFGLTLSDSSTAEAFYQYNEEDRSFRYLKYTQRTKNMISISFSNDWHNKINVITISDMNLLKSLFDE